MRFLCETINYVHVLTKRLTQDRNVEMGGGELGIGSFVDRDASGESGAKRAKRYSTR